MGELQVDFSKVKYLMALSYDRFGEPDKPGYSDSQIIVLENELVPQIRLLQIIHKELGIPLTAYKNTGDKETSGYVDNLEFLHNNTQFDPKTNNLTIDSTHPIDLLTFFIIEWDKEKDTYKWRTETAENLAPDMAYKAEKVEEDE